jgi:hypothetical protein
MRRPGLRCEATFGSRKTVRCGGSVKILRILPRSPKLPLECGLSFLLCSQRTRGVLETMSKAVLLSVLLASSTAFAASSGPLVVDSNSHVVVMEYEAWFGPKAVTFQGSSAMPLLQSADMQAVGGGYDSADPAVIKQHVAWLGIHGNRRGPH